MPFIPDAVVGRFIPDEEQSGDEAPLTPGEQAHSERLSDFAANARLTRPERLAGNVATFIGATEAVTATAESMARPISQIRKGVAGIATNLGIFTPDEFQEKVLAIDNPPPLLPPATGPEHPGERTTSDKIMTGAANAIIDFANSMANPDALLQLGLAGVPSAAQKGLLTAFAVSMGAQAPAQLVDAYTAAKQGNIEEAAKLATSGIGATVLSGLMAKHANKPPTALETLAPKTASVVERATELPKVEPVLEDPALSIEAPKTEKPAELAPAPSEPAKAASKWTTATEESPGETLGGQTYAGIPNPAAVYRGLKKAIADYGPEVRRAAEAVIDFGIEARGDMDIGKLNDRRRSVLNWSEKLQTSFGEADSAQREIRQKVPDKVRREGITNWIQAAGDAAELARRRDLTNDPKLKAGYEAALSLSPEELTVAGDVRNAYDSLGRRGQTHDVLKSFIENYVTQVWDLKQGQATGGSRTLKHEFRFAKARTFDSFFDGEQAGYKPKTKDISELLPVYLHEMNSVIAARQMVAEMSKGVASDGRPLLAPSGAATVLEKQDASKVVLVRPDAIKGDTADYKRLDNQPALHDWTWIGKDTEGQPIFEKSDLKLHPEAHAHLKNVLGKSAIKEWYDSPGSPLAAIPKGMMKGLDIAQSETKRTMLGFFAPFHQVQEGTHAVGHRVNPFFNNPKIDLVGNPAQRDAARHGLMLLPDRASADNFMEGFRTSGLVSRIPGIGPAADWYSHYLFHQYIPGLKFKTYEHILERNTARYQGEITSGEIKLEEVKALSASQSNAAYGHLNYADLARNPTMQHLMQLGLLAPDFLEARARFAGQAITGITGAKVGREQLLAVATLAIAQATLAYTGAKLTGGEWETNHPFEFRNGNRRYTMRSVPEDIASMMTDGRRFVYSRLNPIVGRGAVQYLSGVDWRGQKTTAAETTGELLKTPIPLTLRGAAGEIPGLGDMLKPNTPLSIPEQLWSAVGIRISRYHPQGEVFKMVDEYKKKSGVPKLVAQAEAREREVNAESSYKGMRDALHKNDLEGALREYDKLVPLKGNARTSAHKTIDEAMRPFNEKGEKPFSGSRELEIKFFESLTPAEKEVYVQAREERREIYRRFKAMLSQPKDK